MDSDTRKFKAALLKSLNAKLNDGTYRPPTVVALYIQKAEALKRELRKL